MWSTIPETKLKLDKLIPDIEGTKIMAEIETEGKGDYENTN